MPANLENSAVATGQEKGQFSFQSQKKTMPKNIQIIIHLDLFHMLTRLCSKFFKLRFSSTWTKNSQVCNLDLEKAEEPEINCWQFLDHRKSKGIPKTSTSTSLIVLKPLIVWITTKCGKILKRWGYQTKFTYLLRNPCAGQEAIVRTRHGTADWFKVGKGVHQGILSPCLFNLYGEYIMWNSGLDKTALRNIDNLRYADDTHWVAEAKRK